MASSRLAQHLPSLFGPSRRAAWRLSLMRRLLAAGALLLALQLALGAQRPPPGSATPSPGPSGPELTLPLALSTDLAAGSRVGVYLPGDPDPVVSGAHLVTTSEGAAGQPVAQITVRESQVGRIVENMGAAEGQGPGFVLVGQD